ncbi:MAG: hypothetical protein IPJ23_09290 [Ignavibacteriales bacterium]|nr:hypothetical protein [Ignavibacteriales bacterium]
MKKHLLLILAIFFVQCTTTRISELYQVYDKVNYIYWSDSKKLSWQDFEGQPLGSSSNYASEIHIYNPATIEKANLFSSPKLTSICVFDKKHSWVNKKIANDDMLLYNQIIFNIYELYTRMLRKEFKNTDFSIDDYIKEFHLIAEKNNSNLSDRVEKFRSESDMGQHKKALERWNKIIDNELASLVEYKMDEK